MDSTISTDVLQAVAKMNETDYEAKQSNPLYGAVFANNAEAVRELLADSSMDVDKVNYHGESPLCVAAKGGLTNIVELLITKGARVTQKPGDIDELAEWQWQPLLNVAKSVKIVDMLIRAGADPTEQNSVGDTAIHCAVRRNDVASVELFINKSNGGCIHYRNYNGETPLHIACERGNLQLIKMLLANGADINSQTYSGNTPLHVAVTVLKALQTVQELITAGARVDVPNDSGDYPIHTYTNSLGTTDNEYIIALQSLLLTSSDTTTFKDAKGKTVIHIAAENSNTYILDHLIKQHGGNINCKDNFGKTPLHYASLNADVSVIDFLTASGSDVNATDTWGQTPLHEALNADNTDAVVSILKIGCDANMKDSTGVTPLHVACLNESSVPTVEYLLSKRADILKDNNGASPLHFAAWNDTTDWGIVTLLLKHGADLSEKDALGWSCHDTARFQRNTVLLTFLSTGGSATYANMATMSGSTLEEGVESTAEPSIKTNLNNILCANIESTKSHVIQTNTEPAPISEAQRNPENIEVLYSETCQERSTGSNVQLSTYTNTGPDTQWNLETTTASKDQTYLENRIVSDTRDTADMLDFQAGGKPIKGPMIKINIALSEQRNIERDIVHDIQPNIETVEMPAIQTSIDSNTCYVIPAMETNINRDKLHNIYTQNIQTCVQSDNMHDIQTETVDISETQTKMKTDNLSEVPTDDERIDRSELLTNARPTGKPDIATTDETFTITEIQTNMESGNYEEHVAPEIQNNMQPLSNIAQQFLTEEEATELVDVSHGVRRLVADVHEYVANLLVLPGIGRGGDDDEAMEIQALVESMIQTLAIKIGEADPRFRCVVLHAGSTSEGTKTKYPDEFDFMFCLEEFSKHCHTIFTDKSAVSSLTIPLNKDRPMQTFQELITDSTNYVESTSVSDYLNVILDDDEDSLPYKHFAGSRRVGSSKLNSGFTDLLSKVIFGADFPTYPRLVPLELTCDPALKLRWRGKRYKNLVINIDLVPAILLPAWHDIIREKSSLTKREMLRIPSVGVAKMTSGGDRWLWRSSMALVETAIFRKLRPEIRNSYIACKSFITSHILPFIEIKKVLNEKRVVHSFIQWDDVEDMHPSDSAEAVIPSYILKMSFLTAVEQMADREGLESIYQETKGEEHSEVIYDREDYENTDSGKITTPTSPSNCKREHYYGPSIDMYVAVRSVDFNLELVRETFSICEKNVGNRFVPSVFNPRHNVLGKFLLSGGIDTVHIFIKLIRELLR